MPSPYGTIVDNPEFHAAMFAEKLDRALRVDDREKAMRLITSVSNKQRQMMCEPYRIKYGKDLIASLAKKFSGDSENLVMALMETPLDYDVKQLKQATKGIGTDETALIEILCPRTTQQMAAIRLRYEQEYKKSLEQDVSVHDLLSGPFYHSNL
ncbi:unnamed protein product [Heligmosomoides polygyrus]|uniref:Annexin n=1 Tax=Heligmosomoides polygyrus TaxID=6339 RepID=A0A183GP67_HELPZ|nr:unnamed protein product [Heligmosomoides polygyrus]